ncbi:MAG: LytTR family DNA-binding domain-containing protein [Mariniphaga sp.]
MIRCIAIDDEPLALKQIESYIDKTPFLEKVALYESALQVAEELLHNQVDLMFVDVNMPDLSGMDFVKTLDNPPKVIFTTAYSEYAVDGFRVEALDYLLKPISYPDFYKSVLKAKSWFEIHQKNQLQVRNDSQFLLIKSDYRIVRINFKDINYIEAMSEYVKIYLTGSKPVMSLLSMKSLEEQLPPDQFMRIHRSYIVNLSQISIIERGRIVFDGKIYLPVSEQYKNKFQNWVDKNFI